MYERIKGYLGACVFFGPWVGLLIWLLVSVFTPKPLPKPLSPAAIAARNNAHDSLLSDVVDLSGDGLQSVRLKAQGDFEKSHPNYRVAGVSAYGIPSGFCVVYIAYLNGGDLAAKTASEIVTRRVYRRFYPNDGGESFWAAIPRSLAPSDLTPTPELTPSTESTEDYEP